MATAGQEQRNAESQVTVLHILIVGVASKRTLQCAVGDTRRKDRVTSPCPLRATNFSLRLIDAFNAVYTCDFANTGQDGLELAAIDDFEIDVNLRVQAVRTAFEIMNVAARVAEDRGDIGQQTGTVLRANNQMDEKFSLTWSSPLNGDAALGLVQQVLHVRTRTSVHCDSSPARNIANNIVTRDRIAALGTIDEQVIVSFHD